MRSVKQPEDIKVCISEAARDELILFALEKGTPLVETNHVVVVFTDELFIENEDELEDILNDHEADFVRYKDAILFKKLGGI